MLNMITLPSSILKTYHFVKDAIYSFIKKNSFIQYNLVVNIVLICCAVFLMLNLNQNLMKDYNDTQNTIYHLKETYKEYEHFLENAQTRLTGDTEELDNIYIRYKKERDSLMQHASSLPQGEYQTTLINIIKILDGRFHIRTELMNHYTNIYNIYKDYRFIANNAEKALLDKNESGLQTFMKNIMLDIENIRLLHQDINRSSVLNKIESLRQKILFKNDIIQKKVSLFTERSTDLVKLLRHVDTIKFSMKNDQYHSEASKIDHIMRDYINVQESYFNIKIFFLILIGMLILSFQGMTIIWIIYNSRKIQKAEKEAKKEVKKSHDLMERANKYALEVQSNQSKLLHDFCEEFLGMVKKIMKSSDTIHNISHQEEIFSLDETAEKSLFKSQINILNSSVGALQAWFDNYMEIHSPQEEWREPVLDQINITDLIVEIFSQARFYAHDKENQMSIYQNKSHINIKCDELYLRSIYFNLVHIVLNWSDNSWLRTSINLLDNTQDDTEKGEESTHKKHMLKISIHDSSSLEHFEAREKSLNSKSDENTEDISNGDRFVTTSLYYIQHINSLLDAQIDMVHHDNGENIISVNIPVDIVATEEEIGVPILNNKSAIIVSHFKEVLSTFENQLKTYGMNVMSISDHYAAIGHIVGQKQSEDHYNIIILDHNPPEVDASILAKTVRDNMGLKFVHIIVLTTESLYSSLDDKSHLIDYICIKPACPKNLYEQLKHFIEIQIYGDSEVDTQIDEKESSPGKNFLAIMGEDMSSILLKMMITFESYHLDTAENTNIVMDCLDNTHYDYILISYDNEWVKPDQIIKNLRRHYSDNKESKIILVHDDLTPSIIETFSNMGYDDFMSPYISKNDFIDKIAQWNSVPDDEEPSETIPDSTQDTNPPTDDDQPFSEAS